jgi:hypothetical protein
MTSYFGFVLHDPASATVQSPVPEVEHGYVMTHEPNYGLTDVTGVKWQGSCLKRVKVDRVIGWLED